MVERGVRQGCPLSPLLFVISTVPVIEAILQENQVGRIKQVGFGEQTQVSMTCLADDLAIYTEVDEGSARNLLRLLALIERASGGKVNIQKSKLLLIGKGRKEEDWMRQIGIRIPEPKEVTTYLGASLTADSRGSLSGQRALERLSKSAQNLSSLPLPFESRVLALRCAVYGTLVYPMMNMSLKKKTFKQLDVILRRYLWSINKEGKTMSALVAWESIVLPVEWGGLGVFDTQQFQRALLCRTLLKAMADPGATLWIQGEGYQRVHEWKHTGDGSELDVSWRGAQMYRRAALGKKGDQIRRMNAKWGLLWVGQEWEKIWRISKMKYLSQNHRTFLWRVVARAMFVGTREKKFGFSEYVCAFCGNEEDVKHALFTCPRWSDLWLQMARSIPGWENFMEVIQEQFSPLRF
ncbi:hypothetical protein R1sor_021118 [Riccia sorocarpa]|uniref:Reverse transcriptase domain-containing protein n=1 Tax=Riccia sorocarpa TaxID=122646 RepID=A0ABD3GHY0_9MARC